MSSEGGGCQSVTNNCNLEGEVGALTGTGPGIAIVNQIN